MDEELTFSDVVQALYDGDIYTGLPDYKRKIWVRNCYHFSNIDNVASILNTGMLYSRNKAIEMCLMKNDNASEKVISGTEISVKDYVRFYFRPKTPTQYRNEGIRNSSTLSDLEAHCPIPVFLLFDLSRILTLENCTFCKDSLALAKSHDFCSTPTQLAAMPFSKIYHDGYFPPELRDEIVAARHAEIVIPHELSIDKYLIRIMVRSMAEKEYLLSCLTKASREKYEKLIQIDSNKNLFFGKWVYLENVAMYSEKAELTFNPGEQESHMNLKFEISSPEIPKTAQRVVENWECKRSGVLKFNKELQEYNLKVYMNDILVYTEHYDKSQNDDLPF